LEAALGEFLAYLGVFLMAAADGVVPIFPGESTVVAAGVLAATGSLRLEWVIIAGAFGAVVGDSAAYWIGSSGQGRVKRRIVRSLGERRIETMEDVLQERAPLFIILGRFVPGLRLLVSVSSGMLGLRYRRFLGLSVIAGFIWATYSACLGFFVGQVVENVWVSLGVSILAAMLISGALMILERTRLKILVNPD